MGREDARHKRAHAALRCARWLALAALAALAVTACAIAAAAAGAALSDGGGGGGAATAPEASHPAAGGGRAAALRRGAVGVASDASLAITSGGASPPPLASPGQQSYRCAPKPPPALLAWGEETPLVVVSAGEMKIKAVKEAGVAFVTCAKKAADDGVCALPRNVGREASSYLAFIVSNWNRLPRRMLFVHGHDTSLHQHNDWRSVLSAAAATEGFLGINGHRQDSRTIKKFDHASFARHYADLLAPYLPVAEAGREAPGRAPRKGAAHAHRERSLPTAPQRIVFDGLAQFAVDRATVRSRPLEFYERLLAYCNVCEPGAGTDPKRGLAPIEGNDNCMFFYEYAWHIIFGEDATYVASVLAARDTVRDTAKEPRGKEKKKAPHGRR